MRIQSGLAHHPIPYLRNEFAGMHFRFKQFSIRQERCPVKINTDGVLLGAWVNTNASTKILDIGTGTGVIALMLAQRNPHAFIDAVEINEEAAGQAAENILSSPWSNRIKVHLQRIQDFVCTNHSGYDLIVSNPPYFISGTPSSHSGKRIGRHASSLPHEELIYSVQSLLNSKGSFGCILPVREGEKFVEMGVSYGLYPRRITEVFPDKNKKMERLLLELSRSSTSSPYRDQICIRQAESGDYSDRYREITRAFYLRF